jgi:hypothetical protein
MGILPEQKKVRQNTTQPHLRERALFEANHCREMLEKSWKNLVSGNESPIINIKVMCYETN